MAEFSVLKMQETGIYKITAPSGKFYIGSASSFKKRWDEHKRQLKLGTHHSRQLQSAYKKYGLDGLAFDVLEFCRRKDLIAREQSWLDAMQPQYNSAKIAGSNFGIKRSAETCEKIRYANTGKTHSEDAKRKMSEAAKKRPKFSEETRRKMSESRTGWKHPSARPIRCVENGIEFFTATDAVRWLQANGKTKAALSAISNVINGKTKSAYGFRWEPTDDGQKNE